MIHRKHLRNAFATAVAAALFAVVSTSSAAHAEGTCKPPCFKHPITGELICAYPCP